MNGRPDSSVIVFIDHHENPMDDRAWTHLGTLGFRRSLIRPFLGDPLPPPGSEVAGVVIYGGSQSVNEQGEYPFLKDEIRWIDQCMEKQLPILGLCLGGQLLAHALGARVRRRVPQECEFGYYPLTPTEDGSDWLPKPFYATQAHFEEFDIPSGAVHLASSERFPNQAFRHGENLLGLQFHPEISPDIFRRWQEAPWAMYDMKGSQDKDMQDRLMVHDDIQGPWFLDLLGSFFGKVASGVNRARNPA